MTLQTRAWMTAASLVVLAVAGEFVGAARRRILRREPPHATPPALLPGQILLRLMGADGRPIPQASGADIGWPVPTGARGGSRRAFGMTAGWAVIGAREEENSVRWLEISGPADTADDPLPFGAVLVGPLPPGTSQLEVVLPRETSIAGSIRRGGKPVAGVKIKARIAYPAEFAFLAAGDVWHSRGQTGPDGTFRIGRLGAGVQEVGFDSPAGVAIVARRVESGGRLDLDLDAEPSATVTVMDGNDRPVGNAAVTAMDRDPLSSGVRSIRSQGFTDWNGQIRFVGLVPAAKLRLAIQRPGTAPGNPGEEMDWSPSDATFHLRKQRSVMVRVLDEKGSGHAGVAVTARPVEEGRPGVSGTTAQNGTCNIGGLDAGALEVTLTDTCEFRTGEAARTLSVGAEEPGATVTMARGASLSLRLDFYAAPGLVILLREEGGDAAATGTCVGQVVTWHGLNPGSTYAAFVTNSAWNWAGRADGLLPTGGQNPVKLVPAQSLRATVQWPEGARDREVHAAWGQRVAGAGVEQADRSWLFACLPPGKYVVVATCTIPGRDGRARASVEAQAGGEAKIEVR